MAKAVFEKNKRAFKDDEPLCCNFAAWDGGSVTCDMMVGDMVTKQKPDVDSYQFSSTYTFVLNDANADFDIIGDIEDGVSEFNNRIIYLAITDVFRDCFGIVIAILL